MNTFMKVFLPSFIIFSIMAESLIFLSNEYWVYVIFGGLIIGLISGSILAAFAWGLTVVLKPSIINIFLVLAALCISGSIIGMFHVYIVSIAPTEKWEKIQYSYHIKPKKILGFPHVIGINEEIYIESIEGDIYKINCSHDQPCSGEKININSEDSKELQYMRKENLSTLSILYLKLLKGNVIDATEKTELYAEVGTQTIIALLDDRSIWLYKRSLSGYIIFLYAIYGIAGALTGFLSSLILLIKRKWDGNW